MYSGQQEQQHASSSSSTIRDNLSRVFKLSRPRSSSIAIINNDNETNMSRFSFDGIVESKEVVDNTQQVTRQTHLWSFFTAAKQKNTNNHKSSGSESSTSLVLTMDPSVIGALESELVDDHKQEQQQLLTDMMALATHIESFCQDDTPSNNIDDTPTAAQLLAVPYPKSSSTVKKHR